MQTASTRQERLSWRPYCDYFGHVQSTVHAVALLSYGAWLDAIVKAYRRRRNAVEDTKIPYLGCCDVAEATQERFMAHSSIVTMTKCSPPSNISSRISAPPRALALDLTFRKRKIHVKETFQAQVSSKFGALNIL